jgi:hypothetical protein
MKKIKLVWLLLGWWLLALTLRGWLVRDGNFPFWFDQGRDAIISQNIDNGD